MVFTILQKKKKIMLDNVSNLKLIKDQTVGTLKLIGITGLAASKKSTIQSVMLCILDFGMKNVNLLNA